MSYVKARKVINKTLIATLTMILLVGSAMPKNSVFAYEGRAQYFEITEENIEEKWDKFFDEDYAHYEFYFTESASEAFGEMLVDEAKAEVEMMTEEELAKVEQEIKESEEAYHYFWDNLTPELLWEQYILENPEVLNKGNDEIEKLKEEILSLYEELDTSEPQVAIAPFSNGAVTNTLFITGPVNWWKRQFSADAGVGSVAFNAIHSIGMQAAVRADAQRLAGWGVMRVDAFRHWLWNANSVRNTVVGSTAAQRVSRTRIVTTYREIVTYIHRFDTSLRRSSPTAAQLQRGRNMRRNLLAMNESVWVSASNGGLNTPNGRHEQMDLWNNHWGRVDGQAGAPTVTRFNTRWNSTAQNTGLVRNNGTVVTEMSVARQRHLFRQRWHRPRG